MNTQPEIAAWSSNLPVQALVAAWQLSLSGRVTIPAIMEKASLSELDARRAVSDLVRGCHLAVIGRCEDQGIILGLTGSGITWAQSLGGRREHG